MEVYNSMTVYGAEQEITANFNYTQHFVCKLNGLINITHAFVPKAAISQKKKNNNQPTLKMAKRSGALKIHMTNA